MLSRQIRVGIIGCGRIAQVRHIPEYAANPHAVLAGYYDINPLRAQELAGKYGGKAFLSLEELLEDPTIDAVSVCTANHTHAEITIAALRAGKHVLCEKPMAVTIEECTRMVQTAELTGKQLMIGQNQRIAKAHIKAKELLQSRIIGQVRTFRTCFGHSGPDNWSVDSGTANWFFDKKKSAFGALADLGVHKTDLIQYLLDCPIAEVNAEVATLDKHDASGKPVSVDDNAICIYRMENGILGTMTASWSCYGEEDNSTVLYGTEGVMKIYSNPQHSIEVCMKDGRKLFWDTDAIQTNENQTSSGIIDLFVEALHKEIPVPISGKEVLTAMRAVFAAAESSATGQKVKIQHHPQ